MVFRLFSISHPPRRVRIINAISMFLVFLMLFMYTNPYFMTPSDADWKTPVIVVGGGIAAGVAFAGAVATIPVWVSVTGAVAGGVAAGTAIWEWLDDDCDDCDGSGCKKCDPPDDDDCDDCDGSGCKKCLPPPPPPDVRPYDEYMDWWDSQPWNIQGMYPTNPDQSPCPGDSYELMLFTDEPYYSISWYVLAPWETKYRNKGTYQAYAYGDGTTSTTSFSYTFPSGSMHTGDYLITAVIYRWSDMSKYEVTYTVTVSNPNGGDSSNTCDEEYGYDSSNTCG